MYTIQAMPAALSKCKLVFSEGKSCTVLVIEQVLMKYELS